MGGYSGRVRYHVNNSPEEISNVIRTFAEENKLGDILISPGPAGVLHVRAGHRNWLRIRCLWTCVADSQELQIELQALPSLLTMALLYAGSCVIAVCAAIVCGALMLHRIGGPPPGGSRACEVAVLGYIILMVSGYLPSLRRTLRIENEFARRLASCHPRVVYLPENRTTLSRFLVGLVLSSLGLVLLALMRIAPFAALLLMPAAAAMTLQIITGRLAMGSPRIAWRVTLSTWIICRARTCAAAFLGLSFYFVIGSAITAYAQDRWEAYRIFEEAVLRPVTYYASRTVDRSVLATNVGSLQGMLRHVNQADLFVSVLGLVWAVLACVTLILTIGGMRSYIAWLKMWMLVRQKPTATPWPPSVYPYVRQSARVGLCAAIMAIGVANVLHLVFTVDILSVLLVDQYAISRVIGLSLGWILIDLEAAAEGIPEKSPLGIGVLLALALPTLLVFLGWTFTALDRVLRCRRRTHRIPVEPRLQELVGRLASQMAVRTPVVQVTDRDEPRVETMVSWLSLKATLMISQGALEVLDERELEAAVAHELAHVKYDTRVVLATRWLSALSLFPCNAFAIVLDTEQRELRADRTAASVVASSDAVQKAIAKTSVGSMFVTTRRGGRQTHRTPTKNQHGREAFTQRLGRYAELISAVTHPEFLPDYAHPTLPERLSALRIDSSQKPYD